MYVYILVSRNTPIRNFRNFFRFAQKATVEA
jgi:hypothetical protein